jgi:ketosteroid isomerase-like protein
LKLRPPDYTRSDLKRATICDANFVLLGCAHCRNRSNRENGGDVIIKLNYFCAALLLALGFSGVFAQLHAQTSAATDKAQIEAQVQKFNDAFIARDLNGLMSCYAPGKGLFVFDAVPPRDYPSWDAYKRDWEVLFSSFPGPVKTRSADLVITVVGTIAYSHAVQPTTLTRKDGSTLEVVARVTDVFRKINGKWLVVQEHVSFPVNLETGQADLLSKP